MIVLPHISIPPLSAEERRRALERQLTGCLGFLPDYRILKRSLDARKKADIRYIYAVEFSLASPKKEQAFVKSHARLRAELREPARYRLPEAGSEPLTHPPIVVGTGPCGMLCAWALASAGYRPLVIEQGSPVEERSRQVEAFWQGGKLDPYCNVQFGEGGAGTFSDGKLNTGIKDLSGRIQKVLELFARFGAGEEITYDAKPHIGSDKLKQVVAGLRQEVEAQGGRYLFHTRMEGFTREGGRMTGLRLRDLRDGRSWTEPAELTVLALGHSSRESFRMLLAEGLPLEAKPFAVGVRIQHPQSLINTIQYGSPAPEHLPAADYKLTAKAADGRGVYSFCMCPGGQVVNASSEPGRLCVNGMSLSGRSGPAANAALIVQLGPQDFGDGVLDGMAFQEKWEEAAWRCGAGEIPVQLWGDFRKGTLSGPEEPVTADFRGRWRYARLDLALPAFVRQALLDAMPEFAARLPGYDSDTAVLAGFEARTSSPIRIRRDERGETAVAGLYPAGEGAGYAGGITSAAVDGLKTAEQIIGRYTVPEGSRA